MTDTTQNGRDRTLGASTKQSSPATSSLATGVVSHASKNTSAIASVLRKTAQPERAQFTPSTYPGVTNLGIASQKAGYSSVAACNPDIQPAPQDRLQVQSRNVSDLQYRRFSQYIEEQSGIVLGENKHYLVNSRLSSLLMRFKVPSIDELINRAMQPTVYRDISSAVIDAMTTNETLWFRDTYPYLALRNLILPELAKTGKTPIRIWSAACSSGQEPYSIAMIVQEQVSTMVHIDPAQCQIVGTDISPEMLEQCRFAHYDNHALARGLSAERKARFFKPTSDPNVMRVDDKIKQMVNFKQMNLLGSYSLLGRFDVIFCRNVLIYFSNEVKKQILNKFALSLNPGGYLILGSSESIQGLSDKYDMVRCNPGLAYRLKSSVSTLAPKSAPRPTATASSLRPRPQSSTLRTPSTSATRSTSSFTPRTTTVRSTMSSLHTTAPTSTTRSTSTPAAGTMPRPPLSSSTVNSSLSRTTNTTRTISASYSSATSTRPSTTSSLSLSSRAPTSTTPSTMPVRRTLSNPTVTARPLSAGSASPSTTSMSTSTALRSSLSTSK